MVSAEDLDALAASIADVLTAACTSGHVHRHCAGDSSVVETLWTRAVSLGWLGIAVPEADGGLGFGYQGLALLFEQLGARLAPGPFLATVPAISWLANLPRRAELGEIVASVLSGGVQLALPAQRSCQPLRLHDGRLHGSTGPVLSSPDAAFALVPAQDSGTGALALLPLDTPGVAVKPFPLWDRSRFAVRIECDAARPVLLIEDPSGEHARGLFQRLEVAVAADSIGASQAAASQTVDYLKVREQFGKPLASFQALKHRAARLLLRIVPARELLRQAAQAGDLDCASAAMWAALAKDSATEAFRFVADDCVQLHGGIAMTWEFDSHLFLKRALFNEALVDANHAELDFAEVCLRAATVAGLGTTELAPHV